MPDFTPGDTASLFGYQESPAPPAAESSVVVKMFVNHLKALVGGQADRNGRDGRRAQFRQSFFPGFVPDPQVTEASMQAACPGDHKKWASALLGLSLFNGVPAVQGMLNPTKLQDAVNEMNSAFASAGTKLYIEYFRSRGVVPSEANRTAYLSLLLSNEWRSATALKQQGGRWTNPSWEMYCHWVKLTACWGQNVVVERDAMADRREAAIVRRERERQRRGFPPPFISEWQTLPPRHDVTYDGDIHRVYTEIQARDPKVDLSGFPDIAPTSWGSYRAWNNSTPIDPGMLGTDAAVQYQYVTLKSSPYGRGKIDQVWNSRFLATDFAEANPMFR